MPDTTVIDVESSPVVDGDGDGTTAVAEYRPQRLSIGSLVAESKKPADAALEAIDIAIKIAGRLKAIIDDNEMYAKIKGRKHVTVEGWTTMAAMLGVVVREVDCQETTSEAGAGEFISTVEAIRVTDGEVLGRASHRCGAKDDGRWHREPRYARASMAMTRATGKVLRILFSWIMPLAGYQVSPYEEQVKDGQPVLQPDSPQAAAAAKAAPTKAQTIESYKQRITERIQGDDQAHQVSGRIIGGLEAAKGNGIFNDTDVHELREHITATLCELSKNDPQRVRDIWVTLVDAEDLTPEQVGRISMASAENTLPPAKEAPPETASNRTPKSDEPPAEEAADAGKAVGNE